MASSTTPASSISPLTAPLPAAPKSTGTIASLPVTSVESPETLGSDKILADTFEAFQKLQTQSTPTPAPLTPSRATKSVAEDLDDLVSEALGAEIPNPAIVNSAPSLDNCSMQPKTQPDELEYLFLKLAIYDVSHLLQQIDIHSEQSGIAETCKEVNRTIREINIFFTRLMKVPSHSLGSWLEKESKTSFFSEYHPFSTSRYLTTKLARMPFLNPYLETDLIHNWSLNYPRCVLLLKGDLAIYNAEAHVSNAQIDNIESSIDQISQNPGLVSMMKNQEELMKKQIEQPLAFLKNLDQQLRENGNKAAIEAWLKTETSNPDYLSHFFSSKLEYKQYQMLVAFHKKIPLLYHEWMKLYDNCKQQLTNLGLSSYLNEAPSPRLMAEMKKIWTPQKEIIKEMIIESLFVFKPLAEALKKLSDQPQDQEANRKAIEKWFEDFKRKYNYPFPFMIAPGIHIKLIIFEGLVDSALLKDFDTLYPFCSDKLIALGLEKFLKELPPEMADALSSQATNTLPANTNKELSIIERFKKEIDFFRSLIQKEGDLEQWLKNNNPNYDYPLLWGKKRFSQLSRYRESIEFDVRKDWRICFETCLEKLTTPELKLFIDIQQIPADASPELKAFLSEH